MASPVLYDRLALIGVGLIGGSIARAARAIEPPIRPTPINAMRSKRTGEAITAVPKNP